MVKERPILFSGPMVQAILAGHKWQTRRIVKPQPDPRESEFRFARDVGKWFGVCPRNPEADNQATRGNYFACRHGNVGDNLWVRETWALIRPHTDWETGIVDDFTEWKGPAPKERPGGWDICRAADDGWEDHRDDRGFAWRPSIFMPRWASRLTLEITGVRVERLQSISGEDAIAEGIERGECGACTADETMLCNVRTADARAKYQDLWNAINGPGSWDLNPWVWVIEFKRI